MEISDGHSNGDGDGFYQQSAEVLSEETPFVAAAANMDDGFTTSPEQEADDDAKRERSKGLREKTKAKTKRLLLHVQGPDSTAEDRADQDDTKTPENVNTDPAFHPTDISPKTSRDGGHVGTSGRAKNTMPKLLSIAASITHPKKSIKSTVKRAAKRTAANQLSKAQDPFVSLRSDLQIVEAYDELQRIESQMDPPADEAVKRQEETLEMLERRRESTLVSWITGRHVQRVRVVPTQQLAPPVFEDYVERNSEGQEVRVRWEYWLGHLLLYHSQRFSAQYVDEFAELPFDVETLRLHVERVIVASAPWQAWLMHVRRVYRWEDPAETGRWFALFVFLWYNSKIMAYVYGYIVYMIVRNYYLPSSIESLRASIARSVDRGATAYKFSELVSKHGRDDWLQPAIDYLGPSIQTQIGDMANFLEVMYNFYHWKSPQKTVASLYFFLTCFLISATADMEFCMKIVWFILGGTFFIGWPVSSRYPRYRYLVSPIKWALWDIPTHPEWAFQYLQRGAQRNPEALIREKIERTHKGEARRASDSRSGDPDSQPPGRQNGSLGHDPRPPQLSSNDENDDQQSAGSASLGGDRDIPSFKCECSGTVGELKISPSSLHFTRSRTPKDELWRRSFRDLVAMTKTTTPHKRKRQALDLAFADGEVVRLAAFRERDRAFNCVIAVSGLEWR